MFAAGRPGGPVPDLPAREPGDDPAAFPVGERGFW